ncbi:C69 family dipeptidase [Fulvivirgaceae bacterium LMO-SS25]
MCDTFISFPSHNQGSSILLGKNSDREPNEAQELSYVPAMEYIESVLQCTYICIPQVKSTYAVILSKPFQMWGAEMGANEHGLSIGNEAVFTKVKFQKVNSGLTGMDLLRLALERCKSAMQAVELITELLTEYGQNACGGYKNKRFYYSNSFLIADRQEAWVLETAGGEWAAKRVYDYYSISNGISIGSEYDLSSKNLVSFAQAKGWLKKNETFHFAKHYSDEFYTRMSNCRLRASKTSQSLHKHEGKLDLFNAMEILRQHNIHNGEFTPAKASTASVCMHANGLTNPNSTTSSMLAEIKAEGSPTVWLTGTAYACTSLFKPFGFHPYSVLKSDYYKPSEKLDSSLWWQSEKIMRSAAMHYKDFILQTHQKLEQKQRNLIGQYQNGKPIQELEQLAEKLQRELLTEYQQILNKCKREFHPKFSLYLKLINQPLKS